MEAEDVVLKVALGVHTNIPMEAGVVRKRLFLGGSSF